MKKIALIVTAGLLAVPALAQAKAGVEFNTYPDTTKPGEKIDFTVMALREPPPGGSGRAQPKPVAGRHALVTFRSASGRVVRVRTAATGSDGTADGQVAFPDKGPWTTELRVGDIHMGPQMSDPIRVGVGLTQTTPPANASRPHPASPDTSGFPWVWVLSLGTIGSALLVFAMRRRGRWGAA